MALELVPVAFADACAFVDDLHRHHPSPVGHAAWRAAKALGYRRLITYTQEGESGSSLRGAGRRVVAERPARNGWNTPSRPRSGRGTDGVPRTLWEAP